MDRYAQQAYLLSDEARWMAEFLRLSYTVSDPDQHRIITENHARARDGLWWRAEMVLDVIRIAIKTLERW